MTVSLCFVSARRYSRLLRGKDKHSSLSEEGGDMMGDVCIASWDKQTTGGERRMKT